MVRNPHQASLTRDILLRDVKLFGFMKNIFNFAMSKPTVFVHILQIILNDRCLFFPLQHFSYWVDSKRLKQILYFDKTNKNNKYAIFTFLDKLAYLIKKKFSLRHLC